MGKEQSTPIWGFGCFDTEDYLTYHALFIGIGNVLVSLYAKTNDYNVLLALITYIMFYMIFSSIVSRLKTSECPSVSRGDIGKGIGRSVVITVLSLIISGLIAIRT